MPDIHYSVTINRPISEVFRTAADFANADAWAPDVVRGHQGEGSLRVGSIVTQTRRTFLLWWRLDLNADVIEYQPNKTIVMKGVIGRFPATDRLTFQPSSGKTTVTEEISVRMGCLYAIYGPLLSMVLQRRTARALNSLKDHLESKNTGTAAPTDFHQSL